MLLLKMKCKCIFIFSSSLLRKCSHVSAAAPEPEPEDSYKSLAAYQAEKDALRLAAEINVRKANEGVDDAQWKKLVLVEKQENVFFIGKVCYFVLFFYLLVMITFLSFWQNSKLIFVLKV
jgi:hypothetical protein